MDAFAPPNTLTPPSTRCYDDEAASSSTLDVQQCPSSLRLGRELRQGLRPSVQAPWRWLFANGSVYEVTGCAWVSATRTAVDEKTGHQWEKPIRATVRFSTQGMIRVDPPRRRAPPLKQETHCD